MGLLDQRLGDPAAHANSVANSDPHRQGDTHADDQPDTHVVANGNAHVISNAECHSLADAKPHAWYGNSELCGIRELVRDS
jgi:hypothetical protein